MLGFPQLKEIFSMFWMVLSLESEDGDVIFKDQFVHFLYLLQSALLGPSNVSEKEAIIIGEKEFFHNLSYYGECGQFAFNDIMAECIGEWNAEGFHCNQEIDVVYARIIYYCLSFC